MPEWIWHDNRGHPTAKGEVRFFRKVFELPESVRKATLTASGDDHLAAFINGAQVLDKHGWNRASVVKVGKHLRAGRNVIALRGRNDGSVAAVIAQLDIELRSGDKMRLVTDRSWLSSEQAGPGWTELDFAARGWRQPVSFGKLGVGPWGDVIRPNQATPVERLSVAPGFKVELLHSAQPGEGSWICMTVDPRGRLIISPQSNNDPLLRVTLAASGGIERIEPIPAPIRQAMGLAWAHGSLYANAHGPKGIGLYRVIDADGDDQLEPEEVHFLKAFRGSGEHGYHAVVPGPDGMIYVLNGNHTKLPEGLEPSSPHKNFAEDLLLPRQWDANGHAAGVLAPGGHVLRTDPEGRHWELMLAGFRNAYDMDFSADGELFTFDADMEWDWGLPWYRPTRVNHAVCAAEFGWRSGSGKWPEYYPDSLPAVVNIGIGSPTGVKFGTRGRLPQKYKKALFIEDWSYGRLIAVHLRPHGASYTATFETVVRGKPLNLTDLEFGQDGALYFITGGRGTQSGLYRLTWIGPENLAEDQDQSNDAQVAQAAEARALRHKLERFHGRRDPAAIETAWPYLNHPDRFLRYAARIAIEWQDVNLWRERALRETRPQASITALIALARCGSTNDQAQAVQAFERLPIESLSEPLQLEALRALGLIFIRLGAPDAAQAFRLGRRLDALYPASSSALNRELCQVLIYLRAPNVIAKTLDLMEQSPLQEDQIHYLFHLRTMVGGWTIEQRRRYFSWWNRSRKGLAHPPQLVQWFRDVDRDYTDGASFNRYLENIRRDALGTLSSEERRQLVDVLAQQPKTSLPPPSPQRQFVRHWQVEDFLDALDEVKHDRNFARGRQAFIDAQCLACHRFRDQGGSIGPEITAVSSKYSTRDLLESILLPSKVVSDQYQSTKVILKDDDVVTGRLLDDTPEAVVLMTDPLHQVEQRIPKKDIESMQPSEVSAMPEGLVDILSREEILDLLAYLESGGQPNAPAFRKQTAAHRR